MCLPTFKNCTISPKNPATLAGEAVVKKGLGEGILWHMFHGSKVLQQIEVTPQKLVTSILKEYTPIFKLLWENSY